MLFVEDHRVVEMKKSNPCWMKVMITLLKVQFSQKYACQSLRGGSCMEEKQFKRYTIDCTNWLLKRQIFAFTNLLFWGGLVIPILLGLLFELYVIHPLSVPDQAQPLYFILNEWTFGMLLLKLFTTLILVGPNNRIKTMLNQIRNRGLSVSVKDFYMNIVFPSLGLITVMLAVPRGIMRFAQMLESQGTNHNCKSHVNSIRIQWYHSVLFSVSRHHYIHLDAHLWNSPQNL